MEKAVEKKWKDARQKEKEKEKKLKKLCFLNKNYLKSHFDF